MSGVFVDTNIVLRLIDKAAPEHDTVRAAIALLEKRGTPLVIGLQVLVESWVVATRPRENNGLGWMPEAARVMVEAIRGRFNCLHDDATTATRWLDLVTGTPVMGKRAHDARIVALMLSHDLTQILTLNVKDFEGFASVAPVHPLAAADIPA